MIYHFVTKYTDIFVGKMTEAFALQKLFTFFSTKDIGKLQILTEILMKGYLTTLVLNNCAQNAISRSALFMVCFNLKCAFCLITEERYCTCGRETARSYQGR